VLGEANPIPWMVRTPVVDVACRWAGDQRHRLPELAAQLGGLDVDVIVALGAAAAHAAAQRTARVPIVVVVDGEAGEDAAVARLARTARRITWLSVPSEAGMARQRPSLLAAVVPGLRRVVVLSNSDPITEAVPRERAFDREATSRGDVLSVPARTVDEIERLLHAVAHEAIDGLVVPADTLRVLDAGRLVELVSRAAVPAVYGARAFAEAGGLMALYGDTGEIIRRTATVVRHVLDGATPATLSPPRLQPQLALNVAAARRLGLEFPAALAAGPFSPAAMTRSDS
jgi:putative tryptophan/tyrosine transport system substrate-binding protein